VAALLAQLQSRVAAEERLRCLAYNDELTTLGDPPGVTDPPERPGGPSGDAVLQAGLPCW
jgi:hypothetical protein